MEVEVKKVDDINLIISGVIEDAMIQKKVTQLKAEAQKETMKETKEAAEEKSNETFQEEAESAVLTDFIQAGLKKVNVDIEEILGQPGFRKYEKRDKGLYLEIALATNPSIDTSIDYSDIIPSFTQPDAAQEDIQAKLAEMAVQQGTFEAIEKPKSVENDDVAVINFEGFIEGVPFDGGSAEKFNLKIGSNSFIPGFEEQMIGMKYGEERTITVTFPEDYQSKDLAGKESHFKVTLLEIQAQKPAVTNDAFAQKVLNDKKATLDMLKNKLADQIQAQALSKFYNDKLKPLLVQGLLSKFDFTLPQNIVEQEIDAKVTESMQAMSEEERTTFTKDKERFPALREALRKEAEATIKKALIVDALAQKEGLTVDDHDIQSALYYQAMMSGQDAQELVKYYEDNNLMTAAKMGLTEDKLFGKMLGLDKR